MHIEKKTLRNIFIGAVSCIVLFWLLHETERVKAVLAVISSIFSPFMIGASFAFILNVPMRAIEGHLGKIKSDRLRRTVAIVITLLGVLILLSLLILLLVPQLKETIQTLIPKLKVWKTNIEGRISELIKENPGSWEWIKTNANLENAVNWQALAQKILDAVSTFAGGLVNGLMDGVIAMVFAFYCLAQKETLARQGRKLLYAFTPERFADETIRIGQMTNRTFSNFLSGQCIEVCILGTMFAVAMAIFRMPYIPLISVLIAVTAFIPVVGAWVGCACGAFLILVANPLQAVGFVVMFVIIQQIENNVIYPKVVGTSIGLSGMWVLVAVAAGGVLFGVAGMFLMIPVAAVIYTLIQEATHKKLNEKEIDPAKLEIQKISFKYKMKKEKKLQTIEESPEE